MAHGPPDPSPVMPLPLFAIPQKKLPPVLKPLHTTHPPTHPGGCSKTVPISITQETADNAEHCLLVDVPHYTSASLWVRLHDTEIVTNNFHVGIHRLLGLLILAAGTFECFNLQFWLLGQSTANTVIKPGHICKQFYISLLLYGSSLDCACSLMTTFHWRLNDGYIWNGAASIEQSSNPISLYGLPPGTKRKLTRSQTWDYHRSTVWYRAR